MAWPLNRISCLGVAERLAGGDADLLADDVDAGDHLRHRVLDLQAGVHLDEGELAVLVQELERAGVAVAELGEPGGDRGAQRVPLGRGERGGAGLLQQLLVAALQRAVPLAQMHHGALAVRQHLQLDVARPVQVLLDVDGVVAERGAGLRTGDAPGFRQLVGGVGHLHAAAAAAGRRLDQHGVADAAGDGGGLGQVGDGAVAAGHQRHAQRGHRGLGGDLVAHHADVAAEGPMKASPWSSTISAKPAFSDRKP